MENAIFPLMLLLILVLSVSWVKSYRWTKRKLLFTVLATYVIIVMVTFSIL